MISYWILLGAAVLLIAHSVLRRRLRRQVRDLKHQDSRLDEFAAENRRLQRQSDRAVDNQQRTESN
jgi:hypothetical protein